MIITRCEELRREGEGAGWSRGGGGRAPGAGRSGEAHSSATSPRPSASLMGAMSIGGWATRTMPHRVSAPHASSAGESRSDELPAVRRTVVSISTPLKMVNASL